MTASPAEDLFDLYENAPCGHLSLSPDGRIVKSNATLSAWLGRSAAELRGIRLNELLSVPSRVFFETHAIPMLRMAGRFEEIALDIDSEDERMPFLANAVEVRDEGGRLSVTRLVLFRAKERRRHERQIRDLNAELETRVEEAVEARLASERGLSAEREMGELREQFIAVLGHDLRNPLSSIDSGAKMLMKGERSEREKHILGLMQGSVLRMAGLIDNVLDFARGRLGGGITLDRSSAEPLGPVLVQVVSELQAAEPDGRIETSIDLSEPVDCDRIRMGQMASNLLGNALTHGTPLVPVRLEAATVDGAFELSVSNGGAPIPEEAMARLFQPFFRGDARNSLQGLGLGLHIASEIAKAHGGTLSATSSTEETRFTFKMPTARPTSGPA